MDIEVIVAIIGAVGVIVGALVVVFLPRWLDNKITAKVMVSIHTKQKVLVVTNLSKETKTITAITLESENKLNPFKKTQKFAYDGEIPQTLSIPPYTQIGYELPGLKKEGWRKLDFVWFIGKSKCKISQS